MGTVKAGLQPMSVHAPSARFRGTWIPCTLGVMPSGQHHYHAKTSQGYPWEPCGFRRRLRPANPHGCVCCTAFVLVRYGRGTSSLSDALATSRPEDGRVALPT